MKYVSFVLVVLFLLGCSKSAGSNQVTVTIYQDNHINKLVEKKIPIQETSNILNIMIHNFNVQTSDHGNVFVSINGITANEKDHLGWFYSVNGKEPLTSPLDTKLMPGDHVEFNYHHYFTP